MVMLSADSPPGHAGQVPHSREPGHAPAQLGLPEVPQVGHGGHTLSAHTHEHQFARHWTSADVFECLGEL